jgi:hypothetical protein
MVTRRFVGFCVPEALVRGKPAEKEARGRRPTCLNGAKVVPVQKPCQDNFTYGIGVSNNNPPAESDLLGNKVAESRRCR